jgi:hypothetical protein
VGRGRTANIDRINMTSPYYRPSGLVSLTAVPVAILCGTAVLPAAFAYAWLTLRAPFVLNFFIAFGYSYLIGVVVKYVATLGKVRNGRWMSRAGVGIALAAWYCQWAAWIAMYIHASAKHPGGTSVIETFFGMVIHPWSMISFAIDISKTGTIDIVGWHITGVLLAAVWLLELGMHLMVPPQMGRMRADDPFCEASGTWAERIAVPRRFAFIDAPALVTQRLETDPQQLLSVMTPWTEDSANYSEVVIYGARGAESYVSITNFVVMAPQKDESKKTAQSVLEYLRVPDMGAEELLRHLTAQRPSQADHSSEKPTSPELASALDHLESDRFEAAVEAASQHAGSAQFSLRTDANRICALASSRLGRWSEALAYWQRLNDDELTAHNALQIATSAVMAGDLPQGESWVKEAKRLNETSAELPGLLILTNFVTALTDAGQTAGAMPYLDQIREAYVGLGVTDPTVLYVNRMPAFSAFLNNSEPIVRAALNQEQGRGWYAAMVPHLDERGKAELSHWLDSHFSVAQC